MYTYTAKVNGKEYHFKALKADAERAARSLQSLDHIRQYRRELWGVIGESEHGSLIYAVSPGNTPDVAPEFYAERDALLASLPDPITDTAGVRRAADDLIHRYARVDDHRKTPEERDADAREVQTRLETYNKKSFAWLDAHAHSREQVTIPAGFMGVFLRYTYDDSDSMSDYFAPHAPHGEPLLLAIVKAQSETERLARAAIATYPELAAMTWSWHTEKWSMGHGNYLKSSERVETDTITPTYGGGQEAGFTLEVQFRCESKSAYAYKGYPGERANNAASSVAAPDGSPAITQERDWTWVKFSAKPADSVLDTLRNMGARFSGKRMAWYITTPVDTNTLRAALQ